MSFNQGAWYFLYCIRRYSYHIFHICTCLYTTSCSMRRCDPLRIVLGCAWYPFGLLGPTVPRPVCSLRPQTSMRNCSVRCNFCDCDCHDRSAQHLDSQTKYRDNLRDNLGQSNFIPKKFVGCEFTYCTYFRAKVPMFAEQQVSSCEESQLQYRCSKCYCYGLQHSSSRPAFSALRNRLSAGAAWLSNQGCTWLHIDDSSSCFSYRSMLSDLSA